MLRRVTVVLAIGLLLSACGGGGGGGGGGGKTVAKTAGAYLDDILKLFGRSSIEDVAGGGTGPLDDVFRSNKATVDEAFRAGVFVNAADQAAQTASAEVRSKVTTLFERFDDAAQQKIDSKIRTMICEARLYAQNEEGDVEVLRPWVDREFDEIAIQLNQYGLDELTRWLGERVNDKTSTYSLACTVWLRVTK